MAMHASLRGHTRVAVAALALAAGASVWAGAVAPPKEDLVAGPASGPWRRLFLDTMVVERQQGLERIFHAARKFEGNPVLRRDKPWEGGPHRGGPYLYGTVMWDEGKLRMWYHCYAGGYRNCYAESRDGITWAKPNLGLRAFKGSTENNLFLTITQDPNEYPPRKQSGQCHNASVIKRPWERDPEKRYVLFCYGADYRHARAAFSPDGLRWTFVPETAKKGLFPSSDVLNFFHDPYQSRYVATVKTGSRRGRSAGLALSKDGLRWTKPVAGPVFIPDDLDPDATQVYGMPAFPYQGLYIGLPWIYSARWFKHGRYTDQRMYEVERDSPCTMDVQLAWSWDLVNWTRTPKRGSFIPRGRAGEFDSGMIYTARAPVQVGSDLYFYYGGWNGPHNDPKAQSHIGLAVLRLDGFCSMRAGPREGWLVTRREPFHVPRVTINAKTAGDGYVVAEILDPNDRVVPGFARKDAAPFTGDSTHHVLSWRTAALPKAYRGVDKKLRFYLRNADLYSYLPDPTSGAVTVTYVPAGNGRKLPDDPGIPADQRFALRGERAGFRVVERGGRVYLDMHSAASRRTCACAFKDIPWAGDVDWCLEAWYRVADRGDEPNYGLATFVRPTTGRSGALYLSDKAVGILSTRGNDHRTLKTVPMDTTDGFHWYRLVRDGGRDGRLTLWVDGARVMAVPVSELFFKSGPGGCVTFGPNAAHREGRLHVAKFGFRTRSTAVIFGPLALAKK